MTNTFWNSPAEQKRFEMLLLDAVKRLPADLRVQAQRPGEVTFDPSADDVIEIKLGGVPFAWIEKRALSDPEVTGATVETVETEVPDTVPDDWTD